jgi:ABC-type transport system involved in multi-copper enzyme maturation permease subunit
MKGLLLKDLYMTVKYCRAYLLIAAVFITVSFFGNDNMFLIFYPCLLCGMIPVNLLGYDERSGWLQYSETMPYTRAQIVSGKYLIGLGAQSAMLVITAIAQAIRMNMNNSFSASDYFVMIMLLLIMSMLSSSICLPFIFKLGVEKGRMAYYVMVGIVCGGSVVASTVLRDAMQSQIKPNGALALVAALGIAIYALSWYLSIVFYKKREL